jgi:hypothetical protein
VPAVKADVQLTPREYLAVLVQAAGRRLHCYRAGRPSRYGSRRRPCSARAPGGATACRSDLGCRQPQAHRWTLLLNANASH